MSGANNLTAGDGNGHADVFVRDLKTHKTVMVSAGRGGVDASGYSLQPSISGDGRLVAFSSIAHNLVAGDDNHEFDVFVRDLRTRHTSMVDVTSSGARVGPSLTPAISTDGRFVAFQAFSGKGCCDNVFLRDLKTHATRQLTVGPDGDHGANGLYNFPTALSAHGELVVFVSGASNLVARDVNDVDDVFVRDVARHETRRVSVNTAEKGANAASFAAAINADGRFVAFGSKATNLVSGDGNDRSDVFVRGPLR